MSFTGFQVDVQMKGRPKVLKAGTAAMISEIITPARRISTRIAKLQADPPNRALPSRPGCALARPRLASIVTVLMLGSCSLSVERGGRSNLPPLLFPDQGHSALPSAFTLLLQVCSIWLTSAAGSGT